MRPPTLWVQFSTLLIIELTNWRWSWRSMLITGALAPMISMLGLGLFARDSGPRALAYVLTGNLVISLMFGNMGSMVGHVTFMRWRGSLDYFATLPVHRLMLVLSMLMAFFLISLPSLLATLLMGWLYLHVPLHPHPLLLLVIPLCALPLAALGALLGASVRTPEEGNLFSYLLTLLMMGLGPVLVPPEKLPALLNGLGYLSPATYAASALRQALLGPLTPRLGLDLAVLVLLTLALFWLAGKKLDWRQESF